MGIKYGVPGFQTGEHPAHCMTYIDMNNEDWNLIAWNEKS